MNTNVKRWIFMSMISMMMIVNQLEGFYQTKTIINGSAIAIFALLLVLEIKEKTKKISKNG